MCVPHGPKDFGMSKSRPDGEGSVYQRHKTGCERPVNKKGDPTCKCPWVGAYVIGFREGKPIRKRVTAKTRTAAAAKVREIRDQHERSMLPAGKPATVEQWMNHWLNNIAARKVGELTLNNSYRQKVTQYIIPLLGHHRLDRLTADHIEEAWERLADVGNPTLEDPTPLKPNTVHQTHAILRRALRVAVQRKRLAVNPAGKDSMDAPPADEQEIVPMRVDEVKAVIKAAEGKRNAVRWIVALALGLRQGEALGLTWEHVDLDTGEIRVRQALKRVRGKGLLFGSTKSKKSHRDILVPAEMLPMLKAHKKAQREEQMKAGSTWAGLDLVFCNEDGSPIDPSRDHRAWKALLVEAGVKPYRLHDARHSAATILMLRGVQPRVVQDILGHSQISVTMRYQHAVDELKKDAAAQMGAAIWG